MYIFYEVGSNATPTQIMPDYQLFGIASDINTIFRARHKFIDTLNPTRNSS